MEKYDISIFENEEKSYGIEIDAQSIDEALLNQFIPEGSVLINKFGDKVEVVSKIYLKGSKTDVYRSDEGSFFYFNPVSGTQEFLDVPSQDWIYLPVGSYNDWVRGNLDITTYIVNPKN